MRMNKWFCGAFWGAFAVVTAASPSVASDWRVDPVESKLIFNYSEDGARAVGGFSKFQAEANFDPDSPEAAKMRLVIDVDSVEMPDALRTGFVKGEDWFDVANHPQARFELTEMAPAAQLGMFTVEGVLTIKEVSKEISVPTLVVIDGARALARGEISFDRRDFNVDGEVPFVSLGPEVTVVFSLVAQRAP
ncbi:MAG: YceI family protein [Pseudomonadota bacterium]